MCNSYHTAPLRKAALSVLALLPSLVIFARGGGVPPETRPQTSWLVMLLLFIAVVLLFVIWGLGQALLAIARQVSLKRKTAGVVTIILFMLTVLSDDLRAQAAGIPANFGGLSEMQFYLLSGVIGVEVLIIFFLAFLARRMYGALTGADERPVQEPKRVNRLSEWWSRLDRNLMTRAVPVEREADVLLEHDYDGIRELDNALPPWWKWGFYVTLVIGAIYLSHFHVFGTGKDPFQEYAAEMISAREQEELYKARTRDLVDENALTLSDANGIGAGKALFTQGCVACHAADGGGGIGPNLTDDHWIHGGSLKDIYQTIKLGYPEKGMQSWQAVYSPMQMKHLASFVTSLGGTKPANPKAPQGEPFLEGPSIAVDPALAPQ
jgi:cytochrome c oxidase cbb3-type subunit 3